MTRKQWMWTVRAALYSGLAFAAFSIVAILPPVQASRAKMTADGWKALGVELGGWDAERATPSISPLDPWLRMGRYGTPLDGATIDFARVRDGLDLAHQLRSLGPMHALRFDNAKVSDAPSLVAMLTATDVDQLLFNDCELTAAALPVAALQKVDVLAVTNCRLDGDVFAGLAQLPKLDFVVFERCQLDDAAMRSFFAAPAVSSLYLRECDFSRCVDRDLPGSATLRQLSLHKSKLPPTLEAWLPRLPALQGLSLPEADTAHLDPAVLARMPNLKRVWIGPGVSAEWLARIPQDAKFVELHLSGEAVTAELGNEVAGRFPQLKSLSLDGPGLNEKTGEELEASHPHLKVYCVDNLTQRAARE